MANYLKHYTRLIRKAERRNPPEGYLEKHHVFPVSVFGKNNRVVKLTGREHYIAHALLERIFIKRYGYNCNATHKMIHAFFLMNNMQGSGQHRYVNSILFEQSRMNFSIRMSGKNSPMYGKKRIFTEEHLANMNAARKSGKDHPLYGIPRSKDVIDKIKKPKHTGHGEAVSRGRKGIRFSEDHIKKLKESHFGQVAWNKGKVLSTEHKHRLSESHKNKNKDFITDEYKKKLSEASKRIWAERKLKKLEDQSHGKF
jgi:hypothetical protein